MEAIRRRIMNEQPEYGTSSSAASTSSAASAVSISSTSSASSSEDESRPAKPKARTRAIVLSSDEDDEPEPEPRRVSSKQAAQQPHTGPMKMPEPEPYRHEQHVPMKTKIMNKVEEIVHRKPAPSAPTGPAIPIAIPGNYPFAAPQHPPAPVDLDDIADLPSEHAYMAPGDAETALRDLMSGNLNENEAVDDINEEDSYVQGFKDGIKLMPHQVQGRAWMEGREDPSKKRYGGLLADDMGLGKTIQTLVRISDNRPRKADRDEWDPPTLIVCPLALVEQWASEIKKMVNGFIVVRHQGTSRTADPKKLKGAHVVITTYETVRSEWQTFSPEVKDEGKTKKKVEKTKKNSDDDSSESEFETFGRTPAATKKSTKKEKDALFQVRWWRVVLDEAHNIKNRNAKSSVACCELEAKFRWCLTGTPMQNDVLELYSLIKFLRVKPLSHFQTFNEQIAKPLKKGSGSVRAMKRLQVILQQIMLRRTKTQTLNGKVLIELPPRTVEIISCPFDRDENHFYVTLETQMSVVVNDLAEKENASYIGALVLLLRLRQACNHPLLVSKDYKADMEAIEPSSAKQGGDGAQDADDLANVFGQLNVSRACGLCTVPLTETNTKTTSDKHCLTCAKLASQAGALSGSRPSSAKIRMILKLLADVRARGEGEEKTIIFSQFTSMLDLLEPFLREEGVRYVRYDGSMQPVQREAALTKIKEDDNCQVILVSFKAGSTGLNLTACNNVILVDLWWNPALEDQAFDRAHRYGQTRPVYIYKLKIDDTVEERILVLQEKKRALAKAALSGEKIKNMKLGMDELLALFRPGGREDDEEDSLI